MTPKTFRHPGAIAFSALIWIFALSANVYANSAWEFASPSSSACTSAFRAAATASFPAVGGSSEEWRRALEQIPGPSSYADVDAKSSVYTPNGISTAISPTGRRGKMADVPVELEPKHFGKVLEVYSGGALSTVARVEKADGRQVVVKIIKTGDGVSHEKAVNLMRQEFEFLNRLHAKGTAEDPAPFVKALAFDKRGAMELEIIPSIFDAHIEELSKKEPEEILGVLRQLATAIGKVHEAGLIHRDLKPTNIGVDKNGKLLLFDFGLSGEANVPLKFVEQQSGSPFFMSDNAYRGGVPVPFDDWHSFHLIAQMALLGEHVYNFPEAKTRLGMLRASGLKELKSSPASSGKAKEILSIFAWHTFNDGGDVVEAIDKATELVKRPGKFFQEYFGPKFLETEPDIRKLVHEIFTAKELSSRFVKGTLGLSPEKIDLILDEVQRIQASEPVPLDSLLKFDAGDGRGARYMAAVPYRSDASSLDGEAIKAALAARNKKGRWERLLHLPKAIYDRIRLRRAPDSSEPSGPTL